MQYITYYSQIVCSLHAKWIISIHNKHYDILFVILVEFDRSTMYMCISV